MSWIRELPLSVLKWANGLLCCLILSVFVGNLCSADHTLRTYRFPEDIASLDSMVVVAMLTSFFAAKHRFNPVRLGLAKWVNLAALIYGLFWFVPPAIGGAFATLSRGSVIFLVVQSLVVPLLNCLVFWRPPLGLPAPPMAPGNGPVLGPDGRGSYLANHWRGLLPLGVSFWVNGWLVAASVLAFQRLLDDGAVVRNPRTAAQLYALTYVLAVAGCIWVCVGAWRAATQHFVSGRKPVWAALAKLTIMLFVLNQIGPAIWIHLPKARECLEFAAGSDPIDSYQIVVSGNGEVVELHGGLRYGSANALRSVLKDSPNAKVLKIDSGGGRVGEGLKMMALVRQYGLDTYASQRCMSAATLVLLAGKARGAEQGAKIGFHASRDPGGGSKGGDAAMMGALVSAGVREVFVHRVVSVPPDRMWFPTQEELLKEGVLTSYGVYPPVKKT
jgi:hypothetical protein